MIILVLQWSTTHMDSWYAGAISHRSGVIELSFVPANPIGQGFQRPHRCTFTCCWETGPLEDQRVMGWEDLDLNFLEDLLNLPSGKLT